MNNISENLKLINVGFGNIVSANRVIAIVTPDSAPIKRIVQAGKEKSMLIDATCGRRTRAVLIMDSGHVLLSAFLPETLGGRINKDIFEDSDLESEDIEEINEWFPKDELVERGDKVNTDGMLIIISGPSGSGKGTVVKTLVPDDRYAISISMTTRTPRTGEVHGKDYFFCSEEEFQKNREDGEFLEHAVFCRNYYGTPRSYVNEQIKQGKAVILEIDVNGALQVRDKFESSILIFLVPPTLEELSQRLINRNTENKETIEDRLRRAKEEIELIDKYDYLVINDEISKAANRINSIVDVERLKPCRNKFIINQVKGKDIIK